MGRMELPVLDKCCFVLDLKTGCIVLGVVNSILSFVLAVILITFAVDLKEMSQIKREFGDEGGVYSVLYAFVVVFVVVLFVKFLLDLVFVWAVYKEKCGIIKKYCIFWIVVLVLNVICFLKSMSHMGAGHLISQIFFIAENFYYIAVVRSYLKSINEDGVL